MLANQVLSNDRSKHEGAMSIQEALRFAVLACLSLGIGAACAGPSAADNLPLVAVADVPLGGRTTRMDYASVDTDQHRLYIAHLGDSAVIVFDTQANRVEARIRHACPRAGLEVRAWFDSAIAGGDGNREFFVHARPREVDTP